MLRIHVERRDMLQISLNLNGFLLALSFLKFSIECFFLRSKIQIKDSY